jgi:DNA-binding beta-propeller fold protein YncE
MSIRRVILASALALTTLILTAAPATAATRELVTTFGTLQEPAGLAVDLETGNVYVTENKTGAVGIFGATGGTPTNGVPAQIVIGQMVSEPELAGGRGGAGGCGSR